MRLFPRTYLQGMHDTLVEHGVMHPFANDDLAVAVFDKVAQEAGLPPILEAQLKPEIGLKLAHALKAHSDAQVQRGNGPSNERLAMAKQASFYDPGERASVVARYFMDKAASEGDGSLLPTSENTLANAARVDQLAAVDNSNRSEGTYRTPRGETDLPTPGVVGREVPAPHAPTSGTTVKAANGAMTLGSPLQSLIDKIRQSRLMTHPADSLRTVSNATHDMAAMKNHPEAGMPRIIEEFAQRQGQRSHALGTLGMQGGAALGGAAALAGAGAGAHHLLTRGQPGAEDMQGMEVQASAASPLDRTLAFLTGLHQKTAGWIPSDEAKVAAAGLGAAGNDGLAVMSAILGRAKTADDAESELHQVLQVLEQEGIPPSEELIHELAQALGEAEPGGDGGAPSPMMPPSGGPPGEGGADPKMASTGDAVTDALVTSGRRLMHTNAANRAANASPTSGGGGSSTGSKVLKGLAGTAGLALAAGGAKAVYDKVKKKNGSDKEAQQNAFWADILKAAGEGSLTPTDENTLANAKRDDQLAQVDNKNRPEGTYKKPPGQTALSTEAGEVGSEKKVAQELYNASLKQAAIEWGPKLPVNMPLDQKREEIVNIASLPPNAREAHVLSLLV